MDTMRALAMYRVVWLPCPKVVGTWRKGWPVGRVPGIRPGIRPASWGYWAGCRVVL